MNEKVTLTLTWDELHEIRMAMRAQFKSDIAHFEHLRNTSPTKDHFDSYQMEMSHSTEEMKKLTTIIDNALGLNYALEY